jgi:hypothetical protein
MSGQTQTEHPSPRALQLQPDAAQAVRRVRETMQEQHRAARILFWETEAAVPIALPEGGIRHAARQVASHVIARTLCSPATLVIFELAKEPVFELEVVPKVTKLARRRELVFEDDAVPGLEVRPTRPDPGDSEHEHENGPQEHPQRDA